MGLLLRLYAYPRLALAPLDPKAVTVARGTGITVFYPGDLKQRTDVTLTATRRIQGKLDSPDVKINGNVALWAMGLVTEDDNGTVVDAVEQWVCVNRRTAEAVQPCTGQRIGEDTSRTAQGLEYKFPFNTQKRDYPFFDVTTKTAPLMRFRAETNVDGLPVYQFVQTIQPTKIEDVQVPGNLVGGDATESVTAGRFYQTERTVWVEPYTGSIVKGQEKVRQFLRGPDGRDGTVLLDGTLTFTPETTASLVAKAKNDRSQVRLVFDTGPQVLIALGLVLAIAGLVLLILSSRRRRSFQPRHGEAPMT
jgi:hypothetical protein